MMFYKLISTKQIKGKRKMNKLNIFCLINLLILWPLASQAEQDASLSKTNAPQKVVTNLAIAVRAANELQNLWPSHDSEYMIAVRKMLDVLPQQEEDLDVQKIVRKLFDDVIVLQTVYGGAIDYQHLGCKQSMLRTLVSRSRIINTDPEKWLAIAKFIGQMKGEVKPIDYGNEMLTNKNGVVSIKRSRSTPNMTVEGIKKIHLGNYQTTLERAIKNLTGELIDNAHKVEFDDDAKREEYKENLVKFAQLSEEDVNRMNQNAPTVAKTTPATEPDK